MTEKKKILLLTTEAAMPKLLWAIGQGMEQKEIEALFARNLAGEITIHEHEGE